MSEQKAVAWSGYLVDLAEIAGFVSESNANPEIADLVEPPASIPNPDNSGSSD
jgi:hypothetical protein